MYVPHKIGAVRCTVAAPQFNSVSRRITPCEVGDIIYIDKSKYKTKMYRLHYPENDQDLERKYNTATRRLDWRKKTVHGA